MQKQDAWARYWRGGSLTSFATRFSQGYEGEVRKLWTDFFASLPDGAVIADLGAGNGALEEIADALAAETSRRITVHAIDLAADLPASRVPRKSDSMCKIIWHTSTQNEATGLPDASVDGVTGSYAIEYGDDARTVCEILRILKPDGRGRFLMHYADSALINDARNELDVLEALLAKNAFLDTVRDYLREFGDVRKPGQLEKLKRSGKAEPYRHRMNEAHATAAANVKTANAEELIRQVSGWIGQLVSPPMFFEPKQVLMERLKDVRQELQANQLRLLDMQHARVDQDRLAQIAARFEEGGFHVQHELCEFPGSPVPVGWKVDINPK